MSIHQLLETIGTLDAIMNMRSESEYGLEADTEEDVILSNDFMTHP